MSSGNDQKSQQFNRAWDVSCAVAIGAHGLGQWRLNSIRMRRRPFQQMHLSVPRAERHVVHEVAGEKVAQLQVT